ncbi:putative NADH:ubiquinone reductase (H(+)-translocating) (mitochondrion) [Lupinus albus]|uniref:Putative NADH:ubiquinone reductase (H(+)-translocating) n=1 Tax=Lupinus albus TaxID=3870 RepID=A0A6A4N1E0_LUPAL|nr:putative NADH:ubiquinone reductase (H(+)-translocating) [Lupinus albus]KAE9584345.1 putative NADH:ubiquinone reductase (H(+)-translocating) [Lupinus albus]
MRSSMRRKQEARTALSMLLVKSCSCLFSKVTLFILIGVGACWGRALFILHSKLN